MPPPDNRPKREPSADMRTSARQMHEMFTALTDEGFSRLEALHIIGSILAAGIAAHTKKETEE
jgi:hypothetical protein